MQTQAVLSVQKHFLQTCRGYEALHHEPAWRHTINVAFFGSFVVSFSRSASVYYGQQPEGRSTLYPPVRILTALIRPTDTIKGNCMSKYISANHASIVCILLTGKLACPSNETWPCRYEPASTTRMKGDGHTHQAFAFVQASTSGTKVIHE
jgi:hypothetical protein